MTKKGSVHEPDAELLSVEDAREDAERLRSWLQKKRANTHKDHIPLNILLEAIDQLEPEALRDVVQRAQARLERAA